MTRIEYLTSLKEQGKTKEEAIELVKIWENENVEKPQDTAEGADVVSETAAPMNMESQQEVSLLESDGEDKKLKASEIFKREELITRRADKQLKDLFKSIPRTIEQGQEFSFEDENLNALSKELSDNYYSKNPEGKYTSKKLYEDITKNIKSNKNIESYNSFYNDFVDINEDEIDINPDIYENLGPDAELVGIRAIPGEKEEVTILQRQKPGMSPTETGRIEDGKAEVLQESKVVGETPVFSASTMLKFKMPDGTFKYVPYVTGEEGATPEVALPELEITTLEKELPQFVSDYSYNAFESGVIDKMFKPQPGLMREQKEDGTYTVNYDAGFNSAVDNLQDNQLTEEYLEGEFIDQSDVASSELNIKPGTGFNNSTFTDFGFIYKDGKIVSQNGKEIEVSEGSEAIKNFLKENKSSYSEEYNIDDQINVANNKIRQTEKSINYIGEQSKILRDELLSETNSKIIEAQRLKSSQANKSIKSLNNTNRDLERQRKKLEELLPQVEQGLVTKRKYNRIAKRYNKNIAEYKDIANDYNNIPLSEWKVKKEVDKENNLGTISTMVTLESPNGFTIEIDKNDMGGNWANSTLKEYTDFFDDLQEKNTLEQLENFKKLEYLNRLYVDEVSNINLVAKTLQDKYELELEKQKGQSGFDPTKLESYFGVAKEALNDFSRNLMMVVYEFPIKAFGRTNQFIGNLFGLYDEADNRNMDNILKDLTRQIDYVTDNYFSVDVDKRFSKKWNQSFAGQAQQVMVDMIFDILVTKGVGGGGSAMRASKATLKSFMKAPTVKKGLDIALRNTISGVSSPMFQRVYTQIDRELSTPAFKDMSPNSKFLYSTGMGFVIGQLEKLGIDATVGEAGPRVARYILSEAFKKGGNLSRNVNQSISNLIRKGVLVTGGAVGGMTGEVITEEIQELVEIRGQDLVNYLNDFTGNPNETGFVNPDFGSVEMQERIKEVALLTLAAAGPISVVSSAVQITKQEGNARWMNDLSEAQFAANYQMFSSQESLNNEIKRLEQRVAKGEITREEANEQANIAKGLHDVMSKIPSGLRVREQQEAFDNLTKIKQLEEEVEGKDPSLVNNQLEEIKKLKEDNKQLQAKGEQRAEKLVESVEKTEGVDVEVLDLTNEENVNKVLENVPEERREQIKSDLNNGAAIIDGKIIVDQKGDLERLIVHEDRHAFLRKALEGNPNLVFKLADLIKDKLNSIDGTAKTFVEEKMKLYEDDPNYTEADLAEELIVTFGDSLADQNVVTGLGKDNLFTRIKDNLRRLYSDLFKSEVTLRNEKDLINLLKDHRRAIESGKVSRRLQAFREGEVKLKGKLAEDTETVVEEAVSDDKIVQSKDIKNTLDTIVQDANNNPRFETKQQFQNDPMAAFQAYDTIQNTRLLDGEILRRINRDPNLSSLSDSIKQDIVRRVKENVSERVLKNFDPEKNESLFGYILGKSPQVDFALRDIKKEYATTVSGISIDQPIGDSGTMEIADVDTDIIEDIDTRAFEPKPTSTLRRELDLTRDAISELRGQIENLSSSLPSLEDKRFRTKIDQILGSNLKGFVKDNILPKKLDDYRKFIRENYNSIRGLDIKYLIDLDKGLMKQGKERAFTKPVRRLTTQDDIRKYKDSGRVYVENEAQGVMLYDVLNPGSEFAIDFFTNQTPQNISNRKGKLAEAIGRTLGKDFLPQIQREADLPLRERAKVAERIQRDPRLLFAKRNVDALLKVLGQTPLNARNSNGQIVSQEDIELFQEFLINEWPKYLPVTLLNSSTLANGGRGKFPSQFLSSEELSEVKAKARGNQSFDLTQRERDALDEVKKSVSTWWGKIQDTGKRVFQNDKWKEANKLKQEGIEVLWKQFEAMYKANPENAKFIAAYIQTSSSNSGHIMRMAGYPIGYQENWKSNKGPEREHVIPANEVGEFLFKVVADPSLKDISISDVMPYINDNYFQILINKYYDHKLKGAGLQSKMPDGFFESIIEAIRANDPSLAKEVWVRYFDPKVNEAVSPDGVSGFDPNRIIINKNGKTQTVAEYFGLGVDKKLINPEVISIQQDLIYQIANNDITKAEAKKQFYYQVIKEVDGTTLSSNIQEASNSNKSITEESKVVLFQSKQVDMDAVLSKAATLDDALRKANLLDQPIKKIRVFDFDDTLAQTNSIVFYTKQDGTRGQLTAEEFAEKGGDLVAEGAVMDFSDFNIVRDGRRGPLFEVAKKIKAARGNEDLFVLTARAPESQDAIYEFLKSEGLEFKKENIIGLGNSTGEAKANWIVDKAAEGYNDFYFADDAYQNVKAVQDALSVIDVKSKIQQAKIKQSKDLSIAFNKLLEQTTGVEFFKEYSPAKAKVVGASKGNFKFFIPYSAEDFVGLIYPTLAKGNLGDKQMAWYKKHLIDPYTRAMENLSASRLNMMQDFKQLKKSLDVPRDLRKKSPAGFTYEQAVRVYLFDATGNDVPGISQKDLKELVDLVNSDGKLKAFADQILSITKGDGYAKPGESWLAGTITTDLIDIINTTKRSKFLQEWQQSADAIYSKENLNKLEALYGSKYRESLENVLSRMKSGRNRMQTGNRLSNRVLDYINGSIGTIMFFNTRSAVLQTISSINFINWTFNNPYQAGKAFANQKQYWKDFKTLMNSDYLTDRRNGLKLNISESEIADAASTSKNKAKAVVNYILQKGYLPTQFADSFAIASGGATFYRNKVNDLMSKDPDLSLKDAEQQALLEWRQIAEESQQSSDPMRISPQQASDLGRVLLAFANTPMQYARIQKRAIQDLINGRGDWKNNMSKVIYYGVIQNIIFNALQQAVFAIGFGDDDDEEEKSKKSMGVLNGMLDSLLRGLGIGGQAVSVGKNLLLDLFERSKRSRPEYVDSMWKLTQFSPPISSKISKLRQAAWMFDSKKRRKEMFEKGFNLDNPAYEAFSKVISATFNVPLDRVMYKIDNISQALNEDNEVWQRIAMLLGWPSWQLGIDKKEKEKKTVLKKKKLKKKKGITIRKRIL